MNKSDNGGVVRRQEAAVFFLFLLIAIMAAYCRGLDNYDETWNFTFALNIARGKLPYRDFNMLQTPFSAVLNGLLLRLFGEELLVMRFAGAVSYSVIGWLLYRISRRMGGNDFFSVIPGFTVLLLFMWNIFLEYSGIVILAQLIMIDRDTAALSEKRHLSTKELILTGFASGLAALSKQTYGAFVIAAGMCAAAAVRMSKSAAGDDPDTTTTFADDGSFTEGIPSSDNTAECEVALQRECTLLQGIRAALLRAAGAAIPCLIFLAWLIFTHIWTDFLDMCFFGIASFSTRYSPGEYFNGSIGNAVHFSACVVFVLAALSFGIRRKHTLEGKMVLLVLAYSFFGLINCYPICNYYHLNTTLSPLLSTLAPMLTWCFILLPGWIRIRVRSTNSRLIKRILEIEKRIHTHRDSVVRIDECDASERSGDVCCASKRSGDVCCASKRSGNRSYKKATPVTAILIVIGFAIFFTANTFVEGWHPLKDKAHFLYIMCSDIRLNEMNAVGEIIEKTVSDGRPVYVLDNFACTYLIPYDIYHKNLDMFLYGNLGTKTPAQCLEESFGEKAVYIVAGAKRSNTQFPQKEIRAFCKKLKLKDSIGEFDVYFISP